MTQFFLIKMFYYLILIVYKGSHTKIIFILVPVHTVHVTAASAGQSEIYKEACNILKHPHHTVRMVYRPYKPSSSRYTSFTPQI